MLIGAYPTLGQHRLVVAPSARHGLFKLATRLAQVGSANVGAAEVGTLEIGLIEVGSAKVCADQAGPLKATSVEVDARQRQVVESFTVKNTPTV